MDLQEFITSSLTAILEGIKAANTSAIGPNFDLTPAREAEGGVDFNVAVTAGKSGEGAVGIKVLGMIVGAEAKGELHEEIVSRISFKVSYTSDELLETKKKNAEFLNNHNRKINGY